MMTTNMAIILARKHVHKGEMETSAELCLEDAIRCHDAGDHISAVGRAVKSLSYSVGISHADYKRVAAYFKSIYA